MNSNFYRLIFSFFILILFLSLSADAFAQQKSKNKSKIIVTLEKPKTDERRKEVEALMSEGKYQHDGAGELFDIGTVESVPALLKVLEDNPPQEIRGKKLYICTYIHAISALKKITGQDFIDLEDWKIWLEDFRKTKDK